ncbi:hypothetical protein [Deinococcus ruber]|uniref:Uncharacterized protein n=1 Tax=Deinococcus ruber TaxID=1848197 RepID=A0A918CCY5_9DEIO|nr:hypothetical protein [Deinococcus ruber]GGR18051.1 hypothetical protein GCM10008957_33530 [Deinococcus ruber]
MRARHVTYQLEESTDGGHDWTLLVPGVPNIAPLRDLRAQRLKAALPGTRLRIRTCWWDSGKAAWQWHTNSEKLKQLPPRRGRPPRLTEPRHERRAVPLPPAPLRFQITSGRQMTLTVHGSGYTDKADAHAAFDLLLQTLPPGTVLRLSALRERPDGSVRECHVRTSRIQRPRSEPATRFEVRELHRHQTVHVTSVVGAAEALQTFSTLRATLPLDHTLHLVRIRLPVNGHPCEKLVRSFRRAQ